MSLLQGEETNSPINNKKTLKTVISNGRQKRPENNDAIPYISVNCVVSVSLLTSISCWPKQRKGVSLKISRIRPEEASSVLKEPPAAAILNLYGPDWDAAFLQNLYRD